MPNAPPARPRGDAFSYHPSSGYYWLPSAPASVRDPSAGSSEYWTAQTYVVAETALFDNRNDRLLWTAKSATMDDDRFERTSASIVRSVARRLFAMDLVAHGTDVAASARQGDRG